MKRLKRITAWTLGIIASLYLLVELMQHKKFDAPYPPIHASTDTAIINRGRKIAFGPAHCVQCHSAKKDEERIMQGEELPLAGGLLFDLPIGELYAPNITPSEEGIAHKTDAAIARALRYGVGSDGHALFDIMPFHNTSDEDLTAVISYLRSRPAIPYKVPETKMNLLGKIVKAFVLKPVGPSGDVPAAVERDTTVAYGKYLANSVANCRGCHTNRDLMTGAFTGAPFAGGLTLETKTDSGTYSVTTPNLTPDRTGRITGWSQAQFIERFRKGKMVPLSHMPWDAFGRMSDDELKAIYKFLQTVPAVHNTTIPGAVKAK
ncbi:MAG TPA: c-type cytochrome [Chitinophagaceae bacterium]|nr:c-type cytochrome [Chitinophagaceae bacterium]